MRYTAIALIVLTILLHPKEKELLAVLKTADKICTTYGIEADTVLPNDRAFANKGQLKKVADVLSENAFTFNPSNDTIILRFQCADYLVGKYRTIIGFIKYFPLPISIDAYSSRGECHLELIGKKYEGISSKPDPLIPLIKEGNNTALFDLNKKCGGQADGVAHDSYVVVVIQGGKVVSASKWNILLTPDYWDRCLFVTTSHQIGKENGLAQLFRYPSSFDVDAREVICTLNKKKRVGIPFL